MRQALGRLGVFFERNEVVGPGPEPVAELRDPIVDLARLGDVTVHRLADRDHVVRPHAAVVACDQHRPLGQRHEHRIVHLELYRDLEDFVAKA
jgi:hypothetical protein